MAEIIYTPEQFKEKVFPLSPRAWIAFQMVCQGRISQMAAHFARGASEEEWQACDWLKALGGMPADAGPEQMQELGELSIELINSWLSEESC